MEAPAPCLHQSLPGRPKWGNPSQGSGSRALPLGWALPPCLSLICTGSCAALGTSRNQTQGHCEGQLDTLQAQSSKMPPPKALAWPLPLVPQSPHFLPHVGLFCPRPAMAGPSLRPQPQQVGTPRRDPVMALALALAPGGRGNELPFPGFSCSNTTAQRPAQPWSWERGPPAHPAPKHTGGPSPCSPTPTRTGLPAPRPKLSQGLWYAHGRLGKGDWGGRNRSMERGWMSGWKKGREGGGTEKEACLDGGVGPLPPHRPGNGPLPFVSFYSWGNGGIERQGVHPDLAWDQSTKQMRACGPISGRVHRCGDSSLGRRAQ